MAFWLHKKDSEGDRLPSFSFNNSQKKDFFRFFMLLKLGALVAEYFEEKQI